MGIRFCKIIRYDILAPDMKKILLIGLIGVGIIAAWLIIRHQSKPGTYDAFAQCLKDRGAVFYGAFWCPHCQNQKRMFGSSAKLLPYVECSTSDGESQTQVCKDKKIDGYPTWEFKDGSRLTGEVSLADLASKTACPLPQQP